MKTRPEHNNKKAGKWNFSWICTVKKTLTKYLSGKPFMEFIHIKLFHQKNEPNIEL